MGIEWAIAAACASAIGESQRARAMQQQLGAAYQDQILLRRRMAEASRLSQAADRKCSCCGSKQFVDHNERRICAYCRNEL